MTAIELGDPGLRADVEAWLRNPGQGVLVKENRVRSVHRWNGLYIKRFKYPGFLQQVRRLLADRARREFRILRELRGRGLPVPEPAAWAGDGRTTFLFTREIPGASPLRSLPLTRPLLLELGRFVRRILDAGLRHPDLHIGNILVAGGDMHLVDLHGASLAGELSGAERTRMAAFVVLSFYTFVPQTDVLRFLRACGVDPREAWEAFRSERERYYRDRQSRVWRTGSRFEAVGGMHLRRPFPAGEARRTFDSPPLRVVKELPGRRIWLADPQIFVKEGSRRAWYNGYGLEVRGVPTPRLLACRGRRVAGEWIEGALPLWDHLKRNGVSRDLLRRLALLVRRMHVRGVLHRDLKANNVIVRGGEFWVIDPDRVDFLREVPREGRLDNLAQLNAAVGAPATRTDRLRFFFDYAGRDREMRLGWKGWVREITLRTRGRRHVWPPR